MSPWTKDLLDYLEDKAEANRPAPAHDPAHESCDPITCRDAAELIAAEEARRVCGPGHCGDRPL